VIALIATLVMVPGVALAHGGAGHDGSAAPGLLLLAWSACLITGLHRLGWRRALWGRALSAAAGAGALAVALVSPLAAAGHASLVAHMVEHEILMMVAAPLLVLGRPFGVVLWALPRPARRAAGRARLMMALRGGIAAGSRPEVASVLQAAALAVWHVPPLFQAALGNQALHALQHVSFLGSAMLFWRAVRDCREGAKAALHLFAASILGGLLGALLLFAPMPLFPLQAPHDGAGLSPLEDQQLAGVVMATVACLAYPAVALLRLARWIQNRREAGHALAAS